MHKRTNTLQQVVQKAAKADLVSCATASISHFQSQRGTPEPLRTTCSAYQFSSASVRHFKSQSITGNSDHKVSRKETALARSILPRNIIQEVVRLICRIKKTLIDLIYPVSIRTRTIHLKIPAHFWTFHEYNRLQTDNAGITLQLARKLSVSSATDGAYMIRRFKRQKVLHEKGNAD
ncbi:hypothetical protein V202x_19390 [Gimesia aquarii]|uniref:Uncharacterized protein n=1 Tax=Gimesia aquarii TaxID=2527964 RepID=A0A517WTJ1_9PLAN|nr:hypothetical protein V202x_19390 [Gimesia aquarii]